MGFSLLGKGADETLVMFRLTPKVMQNKNTMEFLQMKNGSNYAYKEKCFSFKWKKNILNARFKTPWNAYYNFLFGNLNANKNEKLALIDSFIFPIQGYHYQSVIEMQLPKC